MKGVFLVVFKVKDFKVAVAQEACAVSFDDYRSHVAEGEARRAWVANVENGGVQRSMEKGGVIVGGAYRLRW